MNNGDCLLREILERPEDDTARLAYADWLEENGQQPRAEFIRDSEAVRLANFSIPDRMAFLPFVVEGCWLCTDAEGGWLLFDAVTGDEVADRVVVRLGFIEAVSCTSENWLTWADRLLSQHPIRTVRLLTEPHERDFGTLHKFDWAERKAEYFRWPGVRFELV